MTPLKTKFTKSGFTFSQVKREGNIALFNKVHNDSNRIFYEVIIVQHRPERQAFGKTLPESECFPTSESWGTYGWSYSSLLDAEKKFAALQAKP